jgi:hypothetical protein
MAKFCSDDCTSVCDFCKYYIDNGTENEFEGEGKCNIDNSEVEACDGMNCNNFECFRIGKEDEI